MLSSNDKIVRKYSVFRVLVPKKALENRKRGDECWSAIRFHVTLQFIIRLKVIRSLRFKVIRAMQTGWAVAPLGRI